MKIKQKLLEIHLEMLNDKIDAFQSMIDSLTEDTLNDAKSSAGDKHETTLSKVHIEQDKLRKRIEEAIASRNVLLRINPIKKSKIVEFGSFVRINSIYLFFSTALPKVFIRDISILAISMDAPLAKELLGKKLNDEIIYNDSKFNILELE